MANYKDIKGFHVQSLSTDPAASPIAAGSWASATSMNTGRDAVGSSRGGTQTAHLVFGGQNGTAQQNLTESWNGSAWTEVNELNTARRAGGCFGTQTSALFACGVTDASHLISTAAVEKWNGTSWSEIGDMGTSRYSGFNAGPSTSAGIIAAGFMRPGSPPGSPINYYTNTETYNGSAWSEEGEMNVGRYDGCGLGTTEAMIGAGGAGYPPAPGYFAYVESYNGSAWTEINEINTARSKATAAGTSTEALAAGGNLGPAGATNKTEWFDGTSWTEVSDISTNRSSNDSGAGTATAMIIASGTPDSAVVETFDGVTTPYWIEGQVYYNSSSTNAFKVTQTSVPTGTWASGNNMNSKRRNCAAFGTQTASLAAGSGPPDTSNTEKYNGTSWTEVTNMPTALNANMGAGVQTAGLSFGGALNTPTASTDKAETYEYDGTNWTDGTDLNQARHAGAGMGASQSAAMCAGGHSPNYANTEIYNGTSWTEVSELNQGRQLLCGVGTTTAALAIGGDPKPLPTQSESWDGTTWTAQGALSVNVYANAGFGTSTLAIAAGGLPPSTDTNANMRSAQYWNGSSWAEVSEMATSRASAQGTGTGPAGLVFGGYNPLNNPPSYDTDANKTEEWGGLTLVNKTITLT